MSIKCVLGFHDWQTIRAKRPLAEAEVHYECCSRCRKVGWATAYWNFISPMYICPPIAKHFVADWLTMMGLENQEEQRRLEDQEAVNKLIRRPKPVENEMAMQHCDIEDLIPHKNARREQPPTECEILSEADFLDELRRM